MQAVILAGGKGLRLRPYTRALPKPLLPLGDMPILELLIHQLRFNGVKEITITVGHLAHLIQEYFGDGSSFGVSINYFMEEEPLGTLGSLPLLDDMGDEFLVLNGDILTDLDFKKLICYHAKKESIATVATYRRNHEVDFGVIELASDMKISGFQEKPVLKYDVSMGAYMFSRDVLKHIPNNQHFGFDQLMYKLVAEDQLVFSYVHDGYWRDLGRAADYEEAIVDFTERRSWFLPNQETPVKQGKTQLTAV